MQEQLELREKMSFVRSRGLDNASELGERVEKLSDWREHVRAHPVPIALAVGALAYWAIPTKTKVAASSAPSQTPRGSVEGTEREAKVAGIAGLGGAAMGFLGSLLGNAVRSYVSDQVQTLITSRGNHVASQQRQTPFSSF